MLETKIKKILIFGATSAIAKETARIYASSGASFYLAARSVERLESLKKDLIVHGASRVDYFQADLNDFAHHKKILEKAQECMGSIDLALIAHGTLGDQKSCEKNFSLALNEFQANFLSVASILSELACYFEGLKRGHIAVISSPAGDRGRQSNYIYGASKGAVTIYLQGLRNRLFHSNVYVTTVKPGFVDTPMTSHLDKNFLFVKPDVVARGIVKAVRQKKDELYVPYFWTFIMFALRNMPSYIFNRLKL
jgi:short-subunit dehydrogenase